MAAKDLTFKDRVIPPVAKRCGLLCASKEFKIASSCIIPKTRENIEQSLRCAYWTISCKNTEIVGTALNVPDKKWFRKSLDD